MGCTMIPVVKSLMYDGFLCRRTLMEFLSTVVMANDVSDGLLRKGRQRVLKDPDTYSSLLYQPPVKEERRDFPLLVFLHGAGKNEQDISNLANINGQYGGLVPSLIEDGRAPQILLDNFIVLSPYSQGKRSFYEEPRTKILQCIQNAVDRVPNMDKSRIYLMGFSDGATLAAELLTTGRFSAGVLCSYGFTGILPELAVQRLSRIPMWVFHSADDVIFHVSNSDRLVDSLRKNNANIRYTRFESDPENLPSAVRGHSTGISASRDPEVFQWLLETIPKARLSE